jgi:hypothetical protein
MHELGLWRSRFLHFYRSFFFFGHAEPDTLTISLLVMICSSFKTNFGQIYLRDPRYWTIQSCFHGNDHKEKENQDGYLWIWNHGERIKENGCIYW